MISAFLSVINFIFTLKSNLMNKTLTLILLTACLIGRAQIEYHWDPLNTAPLDVRRGVGFGAGKYAYLGLGYGISGNTHVFYKMDTTNGNWTFAMNFPGSAVENACAFGINGKGYVVFGADDNDVRLNNLWEFNPGSNTWTQRAACPGNARMGAVCFVINNIAYLGTGVGASTFLSDFFKYDPALNSWSSVASFPGANKSFQGAFAVNGKGYIVCGDNNGGGFSKAVWEYDPGMNAWTQKGNFPGTARHTGSGFDINGKGYYGFGTDEVTRFNDFYEYDPLTDQWSQATTQFAGPNGRHGAVSFRHGITGYLMCGAPRT
jgi:N-acetylneuraminic acid mutarotase